MANDKKSAAGGGREQTYLPTNGNLLKFYIQGSDDPSGTQGAFADVTQAIKDARHFIFVADWSFQPLTRIEPRLSPTPTLKDTVGSLLLEATKQPGMLVAVHTWDHTGVSIPFLGPLAAFDPMNDKGDQVLDAIAGATGFPNNKRPPNLLWRMSSRLDTFRSQHQKFVVVDFDNGSGRRVLKAFLGGLDLTKGRFDFQDSAITPAPTALPFGASLTAGAFSQDDWYNAEFLDDRSLPRQGWQDFYAQIVGPSAWDVLREFVGRWNAFPREPPRPKGDVGDPQRQQVRDKFLTLFDKGKFVQAFESHGGDFTARVVRSMDRREWGATVVATNGVIDTVRNVFNQKTQVTDTTAANGEKQREFEWKVKDPFEKSIQVSYLFAIGKAQNFIYIETQYLIGSGKKWKAKQDTVENRIPEAIVDKITERIRSGKDFHCYIVIPMFPEGDPVSGVAQRQRFFEFNTMQFMAQAVVKAIAEARKDNIDVGNKTWKDFLSFYFLARWSDKVIPAPAGKRRDRVRANQRYQLYVHSKLMIVDDEHIILGSANLNERSLAGNRDSEICLSLHADPGQLGTVKKKIKDLRLATWAQHLDGVNIPNADQPQSSACSQAIHDAGLINWANMSQGLRQNRRHLLLLPFEATETGFFVKPVNSNPVLKSQDSFIFDAETNTPDGAGASQDWLWSAPNGSSFIKDFLAE